jgi:hypothetical protein
VRRYAAVLLIAHTALLASCAPAAQPADTGDVAVTSTVSSALSGGQIIPVAKVWLHLWGIASNNKTIDQWYALTATGGQWSVTVAKIPAGNYFAHGKAFTSATALPADVADYESIGDVAVVVIAKQTTPVAMTLQQNTTRWPPDAINNQAPIVSSLVASTSAVDSTGPSPAPITLRAAATDPDGVADVTGYHWAATYAPPLGAGAAPGVFSAPTALETTWTPPADYDGVVTFSFTVTDRRLASSTVAMAIQVSPRFGNGAVALAIGFNNWPDVLSLTTTDGQLVPSDPTPTTLTAVAQDPDGDDLGYAWDDGGCGGTFGTPTAASTTYFAGPTERACPITVYVSDFRQGVARGGRTASTLTINVRAPAVSYAPTFTFAARSGAADLVTAPGTILFFSVQAVQATPDPLTLVPVTTFAWRDGLAGAFTVVGGDPGYVRWVAPSCAALSAPYRVDVVVDAVGLASQGSPVTQLAFPVQMGCP